MKNILLLILAFNLIVSSACVRKDPKCKKEHKAAKKKGTGGWKY
jgi:hypothetical protein